MLNHNSCFLSYLTVPSSVHHTSTSSLYIADMTPATDVKRKTKKTAKVLAAEGGKQGSKKGMFGWGMVTKRWHGQSFVWARG